MAQRKTCGSPRQINRYELSFQDSGGKKGVYYINYPKKSTAMKQASKFRKSFDGSKWSVHKVKRNVWVKKNTC